jgi:hypothetical protein
VDAGTVYNPQLTRSDALKRIADMFERKEEDGRSCSLYTICFSGHGEDRKGTGDWVCADGTVSLADVYGVWANSAPFKRQSQLFLLLACCFAGSLVAAARKNAAVFQGLTIQAACSAYLEDADGSEADSCFLRDWVHFAERRMTADRFARRSADPPLAFTSTGIDAADAKGAVANSAVFVTDREVPALQHIFVWAGTLSTINGPFAFAPVPLRLPEIGWSELKVDESIKSCAKAFGVGRRWPWPIRRA